MRGETLEVNGTVQMSSNIVHARPRALDGATRQPRDHAGNRRIGTHDHVEWIEVFVDDHEEANARHPGSRRAVVPGYPETLGTTKTGTIPDRRVDDS